MPLPVRRPISRRGARRVRRRRGLVNRWRVLGALLLAAAASALGWLVSADDFRLTDNDVRIGGLRYTDEQLVRRTMAPWLADRPNLFMLPAAEVAAALGELPAVVDSEVTALLPGRLIVAVVERVPVFVWRTSTADFLVDGDGVLLRLTDSDDPLARGLPAFDDARHHDPRPRVGERMERVDLEAVLKLAAVDPALAGSTADELLLSADAENGFVLTATSPHWRAVFGHYTPTLRPPGIIERQVQCLRSLLGEGEALYETIYLAPADDRCGTFVARPTPRQTDEPEEDD
jgi:hypothetical protein